MSVSEFARIFLEYFIASFWHWWLGIVLALLGIIEVSQWLTGKEFHIPIWLRVSFALVVLIVAQFLAYKDLREKYETLDKQSQGQEKNIAAKDERIAGLEQRLEDVRRPRIPEPKPPQLEGIRFVQEQTSSPYQDAPYGLSVTIQTDTTMQPTRLRVECDGLISRGTFSLSGNIVAMMEISHGVSQNQPNNFQLSFGSPPFTPERPIIVTLFSARQIHVKRVERVR